MSATARSNLACHHPPPGLASGEPDDRLQRMIQYSAALTTGLALRGVLDAGLRGHDDVEA